MYTSCTNMCQLHEYLLLQITSYVLNKHLMLLLDILNDPFLLSNSALVAHSCQIQILPKSAKHRNATHPAPTHTNALAQKIWADAWPSAFQQTSTTIKPHQAVLFHRPFSWLTVEPCILPH